MAGWAPTIMKWSWWLARVQLAGLDTQSPMLACILCHPPTRASRCLQGVGSQAFTIFSAVMAGHGHLVSDPSQQFEDESVVQALLEAAGYSRSQLETSHEANVRLGQTPEQWAESGWRQCLSMPFADLPSLLSPEELEEMKARYIASAAQLAAGFATAEGIVEPYRMLWVLAFK